MSCTESNHPAWATYHCSPLNTKGVLFSSHFIIYNTAMHVGIIIVQLDGRDCAQACTSKIL